MSTYNPMGRSSKNPPRDTIPPGPQLEALIDEALRKTEDVVGATLGPAGRTVLLEPQATGHLPIGTKDGVTVIRHLSFLSASEELVLTFLRGAANRVADQAGDGTTSLVVLTRALVVAMRGLASKRGVSASRLGSQVSARLAALAKEVRGSSEDKAGGLAAPMTGLSPEERDRYLTRVAMVASNGDRDAASSSVSAVLHAGDGGNVQICEELGHPAVTFEPARGYLLPSGMDEMGRWAPEFANDPAGRRWRCDRSIVIAIHGELNDPVLLLRALRELGRKWDKTRPFDGIVLLCTGISDSVREILARNMGQARRGAAVQIIAVAVPLSAAADGQYQYLADSAAYVGSMVVNPASSPLANGIPLSASSVGMWSVVWTRSTLLISRSETETTDIPSHMDRIAEVQAQLAGAPSALERSIVQDRLARLTNGLAIVTCAGPTWAETRERRDRTEDAVCSVRSALRDGVVPGAGWAYIRLLSLRGLRPISPSAFASELSGDSLKANADAVLSAALPAVTRRLLANLGHDEGEQEQVVIGLFDQPTHVLSLEDGPDGMVERVVATAEAQVWDSATSVAQVLETAGSIAAQLAALAGVIYEPRDHEYERLDSANRANFERWLDRNPANERAAG